MHAYTNSSWSYRAATWLRANLFSNVWNAAATLVFVGFAIYIGSNAWQWGIAHAIWGKQPAQACNDAVGFGACWAVVANKWRQMLFGIYPQAEQWRPILAVAAFCLMLILSALRFWWTLSRLVFLWICGTAISAWLMHGGLGLSEVRTELWGGLPITLMLAVFGTVLSFPFGILLALGRRSRLPIIRSICIVYIEIVRGVPLITVLFMAAIMFSLFLPEGITIDKLLRAQIAIILFNAAYAAEVVRGGLQALPSGQAEAADALGLGYWKTQRLIVLPQALKITIPAQVNGFIDNFKDTSLVIVVSIFDFLYAVKQSVISDLEWRHYFVEAYLFAMAVYWIFCYAMSRYSQWLERHLSR